MARALPVVIAVLAIAPGFAHAQSADSPQPPAGEDGGPKKDGEDAPDIVVTARKPSVTNAIDRRIYDISASPDAAFSTANDVLTRIPSVTVDPRGRIALRGDSQVKILIDGVEARPGVVNNLQASEIERIEVMTNPSGQFASDGSGGIINIILKKKRKDGLNGTVSLRADDDSRYGFNASTSYKTGRWTAAISAGFSRTRDVTVFDGRQDWTTATGRETTNGYDLSVNGRRQAYEYATLAYAPTDRDKIELGFSHYRWRAATADDGTVLITDASGQVIEDHAEAVRSYDQGSTGEVSLHYTHKGRVEGEKLDLHISRDGGRASDSAAHRLIRSTPAQPEAAYAYLNSSPDSGGSVKGDYERPFGKSRLTAGFALEQTESRIDSRSETIAAIVPGATDYQTRFDYERRIAAAYATWQTPLGKWTIMPGLRIESEGRKAGVVVRDEDRLLPSLSLNRDLNEKTKLVVSYSRRTQAPSLYQLNPRRIYWSRYARYEGNPELRSQETDAYEVGYEFVGNAFSSNGSLYYRANRYPVTEARQVAADQTVLVSVINGDASRAAGLEWSAKGKISKTLDYSVNLNIFDSEVSGIVGGEMLSRQNVTWSGNAIAEYKPNSRDWLQFNLNGEGRAVALQGYKTGFYRLDLTWRHKLTPKWTASLRVLDLTNSSKQTTLFTTPQGESVTVSRTERPSVMIGIARKFGNGGQ